MWAGLVCFGKEQVKGFMDETVISPVTNVCLFSFLLACILSPHYDCKNSFSFSYAALGT